MVKAQDNETDRLDKDKVALAQIKPMKVETSSTDINSTDSTDLQVDDRIEIEKSLITSTTLLLREYGIRKSGAAVRDAVNISHQYIGPKEAVSALSSLGFKASFGRLNIAKLSEEFFPLIAFKKNGEAFLVLTAPVDGKISITNPTNRKKEELSSADYKADYSQYAIIAKELNDREKEERAGHWFLAHFVRVNGFMFK